MYNSALLGTTNIIFGLLVAVFYVLCFYFTLTYFQSLKKTDERVTNQMKFAAVICLAVALLLPAILNAFLITEMTR